MRGFTLMELLIMIGLFAVTSLFLAGVLPVFLRFQNQQVATSEVGSQLNFTLQTLQRLIRESSLALVNDDGNKDNDGALGIAHSRLALRTADPATDWITIWLDSTDNVVKIQEDGGPTTPITTDAVKVDNLTFTKFRNYPGQDTIQINLTMTSGNLTRSLESAVSRVSAATFDSSLIPGAADTWNVGQSGAEWKDANFTGDLRVKGNIFDRFNCDAACEEDVVTGLVWDNADRASAWWNTASNTCLTKGARLPTVGELYQRNLAGERWADDLTTATHAFTVNGQTIGTGDIVADTRVYRCVQ